MPLRPADGGRAHALVMQDRLKCRVKQAAVRSDAIVAHAYSVDIDDGLTARSSMTQRRSQRFCLSAVRATIHTSWCGEPHLSRLRATLPV